MKEKDIWKRYERKIREREYKRKERYKIKKERDKEEREKWEQRKRYSLFSSFFLSLSFFLLSSSFFFLSFFFFFSDPHLRKFSIWKLNVGVCFGALVNSCFFLGSKVMLVLMKLVILVSKTSFANRNSRIISEFAETVALPFSKQKKVQHLLAVETLNQMIILVQEAQSLRKEESTESTATKPVENTQPITVQPETSNATVELKSQKQPQI